MSKIVAALEAIAGDTRRDDRIRIEAAIVLYVLTNTGA